MKCEDCGAENAQYVIEPFDWDVHGEENWMWLCKNCEQDRSDEI